MTREEWSLQQTPMGSLVVVRFDAADVEQAFAHLAASTNDFSTWFKDRVKEIAGVDLSAPSDEPLPELILEWSA